MNMNSVFISLFSFVVGMLVCFSILYEQNGSVAMGHESKEIKYSHVSRLVLYKKPCDFDIESVDGENIHFYDIVEPLRGGSEYIGALGYDGLADNRYKYFMEQVTDNGIYKCGQRNVRAFDVSENFLKGLRTILSEKDNVSLYYREGYIGVEWVE